MHANPHTEISLCLNSLALEVAGMKNATNAEGGVQSPWRMTRNEHTCFKTPPGRFTRPMTATIDDDGCLMVMTVVVMMEQRARRRSRGMTGGHSVLVTTGQPHDVVQVSPRCLGLSSLRQGGWFERCLASRDAFFREGGGLVLWQGAESRDGWL